MDSIYRPSLPLSVGTFSALIDASHIFPVYRLHLCSQTVTDEETTQLMAIGLVLEDILQAPDCSASLFAHISLARSLARAFQRSLFLNLFSPGPGVSSCTC